MQTRTLTVTCENGLHLRVAAEVVKRVQIHNGTVHVRCNGCPKVNACSIMELILLGAGQGTEIQITAEGGDEEAVLDSLTEIFSDGAGI
jgi:phosphotransferase system HPr (HPr) family protein